MNRDFNQSSQKECECTDARPVRQSECLLSLYNQYRLLFEREPTMQGSGIKLNVSCMTAEMRGCAWSWQHSKLS